MIVLNFLRISISLGLLGLIDVSLLTRRGSFQLVAATTLRTSSSRVIKLSGLRACESSRDIRRNKYVDRATVIDARLRTAACGRSPRFVQRGHDPGVHFERHAPYLTTRVTIASRRARR